MKLGLSSAAALCGLFLATSTLTPAAAQGVKIGILNDQSGVYADYGGKGSIEAAKMAIEDFGGEVLGHKIEMVTADHQNKPDLAVSIARRWYDVEIRYHGNLEKVRFSGSISRYENIDKLLKTIALAGGVRFERKERRVEVM